jgi:uncharacterized cupin superfamily protein
MADYTAKRIDDMEAIFGGGFRKARAELGVTSFGVQVLEFPPGLTTYPEHDHASDGQEEVYLLLDGSAGLEVDGEAVPFDAGTMVRVGANTKRKLTTAEQPARILVIGATPGSAYEVKQFTELGEPDPMAAA